MDSSYGLRSHSWCRVLGQVVQDLSMTAGTMETVSELTSSPPLHSPVLDQPDGMFDCTLGDTLTQSMQNPATGEDATPAFLIDPQLLPDDAEVHISPMSKGTQTTL